MLSRLAFLFAFLASALLAQITLRTDKTTYIVRTQVVVTWSGLPGNGSDWVSVERAGSAANSYTGGFWTYTGGRASGSFTTNEIEPGTYEVRAYLAGGTAIAARSAQFTVAYPVTTVRSDKTAYLVLERPTLSWTDAPGWGNDWISIEPLGSAANTYSPGHWAYTDGARAGSRTMNDLEPGTYEVRFYYRREASPIRARSAQFTVAYPTPTLTTNKASYAKDERITVSWTNMPGYGNDWVSMERLGSAAGSYNSGFWAYTNGAKSGSVTLNALPEGTYEVRAYFRGENGPIRARSLQFTVGTTSENTSNLLRNPGAEEGAASPEYGPIAIPGWVSDNQVTVYAYGTDPNWLMATAPGPQDRGLKYFGGGYAARSVLTQSVSVASAAAAIDAGTQPYTLSGYLGGWQGQNDNARAIATFKNAAGASLGTAQIGPVMPNDRGGIAALVLRTATGRLPAGTRTVDIQLIFERAEGSANDGYADNIVFSLSSGSAPPPTCTYSLNPTNSTVAAAGGTGRFAVTTATGCTWTAVSSATSWLTVTAGATGSGNGTVDYRASANTGAARTATITVGGQTFTVTQSAAACSYTLAPTSANIPGPGGTGSFNVTAAAGCSWTAQSAVSWITITGGASGSGNGTVSYSVAANTAQTSRTGTITAGGVTFTVTQAAAVSCTVSISPLNAQVAGAGGFGTITVTAPAGCAWSAQSAASWITITAGASGTGNGAVNYQVAANTTSSQRSAAITVSGAPFTITQAPAPSCTVDFYPRIKNFPAAGGEGEVEVFASTKTCPWTVSTNVTWIELWSSSTNTGSDDFDFLVAPNTSTSPRTATILVGGVPLTVNQAGTTPDIPVVSEGGVVNAASYLPANLPNGAIAQGSFFSIFGEKLGPAAGVASGSFPLPTTLAGVSVEIKQGGITVNAIPVFVIASQINAILPSTAPLGDVELTVIYNGKRSLPQAMKTAKVNFGAFSVAGGRGPGIFQNYNSPADQPLNTRSNSARPGQVITMWGTGLGPISIADNVAPPVGDLPTPVEIYVGHKLAKKLYSGRAPCCSGVDQIVFEIPADVPVGCYVPVQVRVGESSYSNSVTMAVAPAGGQCTDGNNPFAAANVGGSKNGAVFLVRVETVLPLEAGKPPAAINLDLGTASFQEQPAAASADLAYNPLYSTGPRGTCAVYAGNLETGGLLDTATGTDTSTTIAGKELDAGPKIEIVYQNGASRELLHSDQEKQKGPYIGLLGGQLPIGDAPALPMFLEPGNYTIRGLGGAHVGAFSANIVLKQGTTWANKDSFTVVDRTRPLTLTWTGGSDDQVVIIGGFSTNQMTKASAGFYCSAPANARTFTIPVHVLGALPVSVSSDPDQPLGALFMGSVQEENMQRFTAPGLNSGTVIHTNLSIKLAPFK